MILTAKQLLSNLPNKQSIKGYMFRLIQGLLSNQQRLAALAVCQCAPSEGTVLKGGDGDGGRFSSNQSGILGLRKDFTCARQAVQSYWRYFISTSEKHPRGVHLMGSSTNVGRIKNLNLTLSAARGGTDPISHNRRDRCMFFLQIAQGLLICSRI